MVRAIVINRASDTERRRRIEETIPRTLDWAFLEATDGHRPAGIPARYTRLVAETYWRNKRLKPGAVGAFISHYRVWEMCVAADETILVIEDDAIFNAAGPSPEATMAASDADIVFMNKRAVTWNRLFHGAADAIAAPVADLGETIEGMVTAGIVPPHQRAVGGDCYLVTPRGASQLMALADRCGTFMGPDWFVVASCLVDRRLDGPWTVPGQTARLLPPGTERIATAVTGDYLTETSNKGIGASVIAHGEVVDSRDYIAMLTRPAPAD